MKSAIEMIQRDVASGYLHTYGGGVIKSNDDFVKINLEDYNQMKSEIRRLNFKLENEVGKYCVEYSCMRGYMFLTANDAIEEINNRHSSDLRAMEKKQIKLNIFGKLMRILITKK